LAKSDEGEFELILGNRQLISVFLIVVVLLGVFFSMGYIVGRNSSAPAAETAHTGGKPVAVEPPSAEPQAASSSPAPAQEPPASPPESKPAAAGPVTHPETSTPATVKPAPASVAKQKPSAVGLASVTTDPPTGQYWQVVAVARPDAEIISEALNKKGFHALVSPAPKEGIFRVLVGPFQTTATQAQARTSLEGAGFKNPILKRY
jgi:DedD protein